MTTSPCRNPDCGNVVTDLMPSGFCFHCSTELAHQEKELESDLAKVLRLEAEFVEYCLKRGLPNPHE